MFLEVSDRLEHILNETIYLIEIRKNLTCKEDIERDETLKRSVVRSLEVIGEATKALPRKLLENHQNIDWRSIAGMRDSLIHRYFQINYEVVWIVIQNKIPELSAEVRKMLGQIYRSEYLNYKQQINKEQQIESIDREIASIILQEYLPKFRSVAIAKIERIISYSDRSLELKSNNKIVESYVKSIIESAVSESAE